MTEEERQRISDMLLERMVKSAFNVSPTACHDEEYIKRCKNFIASKTDETLLALLIRGGTNVLSTDKLTR